MGGSVFKGEGPLLLDTILHRVHRAAPAAILVRPRLEPVVGAVLLGLEAAGIVVDDQLYTMLQETMPGFPK